MRRFLILFAGTAALLGLTALNASAEGVFDRHCGGKIDEGGTKLPGGPGRFSVKDFHVATTNPYGSAEEFTEPSGDPEDEEGVGVALRFCTRGSQIYHATVNQPAGYPTHYRNLLCPHPAIAEDRRCYGGWSLNRTISIALPPGMRVRNTVECKGCGGGYIVGKISLRVLTWGWDPKDPTRVPAYLRELPDGAGGPIAISNDFSVEPRGVVGCPRPQDISLPDELVACWYISGTSYIWVVRRHSYVGGVRDVMTFGQLPSSLEVGYLDQVPAGITAIEVQREKDKGGKEPEPEPGLYLCGKLGSGLGGSFCGSGEDPVVSWNGHPADDGCGPDNNGMWQAQIRTFGFYRPAPGPGWRWTDELVSHTPPYGSEGNDPGSYGCTPWSERP